LKFSGCQGGRPGPWSITIGASRITVEGVKPDSRAAK